MRYQEITNVQKFLYHASPRTNEAEILRNGFIPNKHGQWGSDYGSPRCYFAQSPRDAYTVAMQMMERNPNLGRMSIFYIDLTGIKNTFHRDPEWNADDDQRQFPAVYTEEPIPASAILPTVIHYDREDFEHWESKMFDDEDDW